VKERIGQLDGGACQPANNKFDGAAGMKEEKKKEDTKSTTLVSHVRDWFANLSF
jgi:hypothetical protein